MERNSTLDFDIYSVPTPGFVVHTGLLEENLHTLASIKERTGAKVLLALKAFSMFSLFPLISEYLDGTCASSPHEARLGKEEFGKEVHTFGAAYSEKDFQELLQYSDHIIFNSFYQWETYGKALSPKGNHSFGLRINPQHSEGSVPIYDPCGRYSRLGIPIEEFKGRDLTGITGLHFHTLCQQNADALERTVDIVLDKWGPIIRDMEWINIGGGHHITRDGYNSDLLVSIIKHLSWEYNVQVIIEPGEAVVLDTGFLVSEVLDIVYNEMDIAILDTSAATHMPDVIEMPYRPPVIGSGLAGEKEHTYKLTGPSCLAGDVIGDYSFDRPLQRGDRIVFGDMALYTMVKTNTFNGINLPSICIYDNTTGRTTVVKDFGYDDFKGRLS